MRKVTNTDAAGNSLLSMNSPGIFKSDRLGFIGKEESTRLSEPAYTTTSLIGQPYVRHSTDELA
jgi:hypothetical protein